MTPTDYKFYFPDAGLDGSKTASEHYRDLNYYIYEKNISAIEKIEEICEAMKMPYEAQMCRFAKEEVEQEEKGTGMINIGKVKADMAETLHDMKSYSYSDYFEDIGLTVDIYASRTTGYNAEYSIENLDASDVIIAITQTNPPDETNGYPSISSNSARISFGEFKQMKSDGFDPIHGSLESLINELMFYAPEYIEEWKPEEQETDKKEIREDKNKIRSDKNNKKNKEEEIGR